MTRQKVISLTHSLIGNSNVQITFSKTELYGDARLRPNRIIYHISVLKGGVNALYIIAHESAHIASRMLFHNYPFTKFEKMFLERLGFSDIRRTRMAGDTLIKGFVFDRKEYILDDDYPGLRYLLR